MTGVRKAGSWLRRLAERGGDVVVLRDLPHGFSACHDIARRMRDLRVIVDVGANVGQSANMFAGVWPDAQIHSIEPIASTFRQLVSNTAGNDNISCVRCAFGARAGNARMVLHAGSQNNRVLHAAPVAAGDDTETVELVTMDQFCSDRGLDHVDLLKIDTEGYDLEVLKGARELLAQERISFVQVEAGMNKHNEKHVPFAHLQRFLEAEGYVLFGVYDQTPEWNGQARLRFANCVFVSDKDSHLPPSQVGINATRAGLTERHRRPPR